jgi:predicted esterase
MTLHDTSFTFKARYYKLGEINETTRQVWFVLHGYGQLAEYFLKKFSVLEQQQICVIAPEGLSRFYLEDVTKRSQGGSQRVGATWMTRENRLMDIENYLAYLDQIYHAEIGSRAHLDVTILGFSQGAATASRWAINNTVDFDRLVLWAGIFPDDMDFEKAHEILASKKVQLVYGTADPFLNDQRLVQMRTITERLNVGATVHTFNGAHELDADTLRLLAQ